MENDSEFTPIYGNTYTPMAVVIDKHLAPKITTHFILCSRLMGYGIYYGDSFPAAKECREHQSVDEDHCSKA